RILELELNMVQQRIFNSAAGNQFVFTVTPPAKDYLLREGTDVKYGARHLKRALDHALVHPLSSLMATGQVCGGDLVRVDYDDDGERLTFFKEAENLPATAMAQMVDPSVLAGVSAVRDSRPLAIHAAVLRR